MRWKRILVVIGCLIAAIFVIVYFILMTYDFNKLKPKIAQAAREATGRELTLAGDFKVAVGLSPSFSIDGVSFQNASWGSRPELINAKRLEIQVALLPLIRGEVYFKRLILVEPDILIETDPSGRSNLEFKPSEKPKPEEKKAEDREVLPPLVFEEIRIEKGVLTFHDGRRRKTYKLNVEKFTAALPGGEKPIEWSLKGAFDGRPLQVNGRTGSLKAMVFPEKPWPLKLSAKFGEAALDVHGSIQEPLKGKGLDLTLQAGGPSIQKVAEFGGVTAVPELGPFKVSVKITDPPGKIVFSDLKAQLGENDLAGSVALSVAGKRPQVEADLSSRNLDLRLLMGKGEKEIKEAKPSGKSTPQKEKVFPNEPLPLDGLKAVDVKIKIQAGQTLVSPVSLKDLKADVILEDGNLLVQPLKFTLTGGKVIGVFDLRTQEKNPSFKFDFKVDQLPVGPLLKEFKTREFLEGNLDAEIDLRGKGRSIAEWMAGLDGKTVAVLGKGRLQNKYLDLLDADLARSLLRLLNPFQKGEDFTKINCLVSGFDIKKGLAVCSALVLDTDQMSVVGEGDINLREERLNFSIHPSPKKGIGTDSLGKISLGLGELANSFRLGGTLAKPSLVVDTREALAQAGKAVGGIALFGPAGVLTALASPTPGDPNPCLTAIERSKKGGRPPAGEKGEKKTGEAQKESGVLQEGVESLERGFKKFFGK